MHRKVLTDAISLIKITQERAMNTKKQTEKEDKEEQEKEHIKEHKKKHNKKYNKEQSIQSASYISKDNKL